MVSALAALMLAVVGCSDDDDNNPMSSTPANAQVMIIHASPDAPAVDIILNDGAPAVQDLAFPSNTGYVSLAPATYNVKVNVANTAITAIDADLTLESGINYSVFATGAVANIAPLVLEDNLATPAAGKAHVRFVHLSPDAPAVDVAVSGGPVLFGNVAFRGYEDFTPVDAGTYNLDVRLAGTTTSVLPLPNTTLEAGKIYTVFARGFVSGTATAALSAEIIVNN